MCWRSSFGIVSIWSESGRQSMRPETTASCGKLARGADTGMWVSGGFRDSCRRALAAGLYHTRLLQVARRFEGTHELCSVPGARWPRLRRFAGPKSVLLLVKHLLGQDALHCPLEDVPLFKSFQLERGGYSPREF